MEGDHDEANSILESCGSCECPIRDDRLSILQQCGHYLCQSCNNRRLLPGHEMDPIRCRACADQRIVSAAETLRVTFPPAREVRLQVGASHAESKRRAEEQRSAVTALQREEVALRQRIGEVDQSALAAELFREQSLATDQRRAIVVLEAHVLDERRKMADIREQQARIDAQVASIVPQPTSWPLPVTSLHAFDPLHDDVVMDRGVSPTHHIPFSIPSPSGQQDVLYPQSFYVPYYWFEIRYTCMAFIRTAQAGPELTEDTLKERNADCLHYPTDGDFTSLRGATVLLHLDRKNSNNNTTFSSAGTPTTTCPDEVRIQTKPFLAIIPACPEAETNTIRELFSSHLYWPEDRVVNGPPPLPNNGTTTSLFTVSFTPRRQWNQFGWRMWKRAVLDRVFEVTNTSVVAEMRVVLKVESASVRCVALPVHTLHKGLKEGAICGFSGDVVTK